MASDLNPTTRRWLLGSIAVFAVLIIVTFVLASVRSSGNDAQPAPVEQETALSTERMQTPDSGFVGTALRLVEYSYEPGTRTIEGSLMNTTNFSYVNVQVGFDLLQSDSTVVGQAIDTTGTVQPGNTWLFNIVVPGDAAISAVRPSLLRGGRMEARAAGTTTDPARTGRVGGETDMPPAKQQAYGNETVGN